MKIKKILFVIVAFLSIFMISSCGKDKDIEGKVKVTYNLEGGTFLNVSKPIIQYYDFPDGMARLITAPEVLAEKPTELIRANYTFQGWCKTKTVIDEENHVYEYSNPWDFKHDELTEDSLELYAYWKKNITYKYEVCYKDDSGETVVLGFNEVNPGDKFEDFKRLANKRFGYTPIGFINEDGTDWDPNFKHPGDEQLVVQVFVKYIVGDFKFVNNARDLRRYQSENIYLNADIDMNGEEFSFKDYKGVFEGNGHTISNFKVQYDPTKNGLIEDFNDSALKALNIGIFKNLENATIRNVNFTNITVEIKTTLSIVGKIYVSPLTGYAKNSVVSNVNVTGTVTVLELPAGFTEENLIIVADRPFFKKDDKTTVENVTVNITRK